MQQDETFKLAETTPSREVIENFGTSRSNPETDKAIKDEADRRFISTLSYIEAPEFLWRKVPEDDRAYEYETLWDPEAQTYQDTSFPDTRMEEQELYNPEVLDFVKQAVALRLFANSQLDEYVVAKKDFSIRPDDPVFTAISGNYDAAVRGLYSKMVSNVNDEEELEKRKLFQKYGFDERDLKEYYDWQSGEVEENPGFSKKDIELLELLNDKLYALYEKYPDPRREG